MKKRVLCMLLSLTMVITMAAGCGGKTEAPAAGESTEAEGGEEQVTIRFQTWNPGEEAYNKEMFAQFEKENPGIKVEHVYMPYTDHVEKMKIDLSAGEAADVFGVQTGAMYNEFRDFEVDLTDLMAQEYGENWVSNYNEYAMSLLKADDGRYYGLPLGLSYAGFAWADMKTLGKYGIAVPDSYDKLLAASKTLRDNGEYPLAIGAKDDWINIDTWMNIANDINSEKLYSAIEGETPFTDPEMVQALEIWQNCFTEGIFQDGATGVGMYVDTTDMFQKEGSIPMILNGSWAEGAFMDSDEQSQAVYNSPDSDHEAFVIDWNNDGKTAPVQEAVDVALAINNQSKHQEAAWTFVNWMVTKGADFLINGHLQYMPAATNMELNVEGLSEDGMQCLENIVAQGSNVAGYREMSYPELKEVISTELTKLAIEETTPQEAAEAIEAASQAQAR